MDTARRAIARRAVLFMLWSNCNRKYHDFLGHPVNLRCCRMAASHAGKTPGIIIVEPRALPPSGIVM